MVQTTEIARHRAVVLDELAMLASASAQAEYEKNVPHVFIPAELIERFASDVYRPKCAEFVDAFTESELKDLARVYGLVFAASERMQKTTVHSVADLQKLPEWRQVMSLAKTLDDRFRRA